MDSPISKDLCHSPFLRDVLPQRIGRCSIRQTAGRSGREELSAGRTGDTVQPRRTLCRYVSDDGIAAARSYVSILDKMIVKFFFVDELNYENLTARKINTQNIFNTKISRSTALAVGRVHSVRSRGGGGCVCTKNYRAMVKYMLNSVYEGSGNHIRVACHELLLIITLSAHVPIYSDTELHSPSWFSFCALTSKSYLVSGLSPSCAVIRMLVVGAFTVILQ